MTAPADLHYTRDHQWIRLEGEVATIGLTDYAQEELGDVVFVELPDNGEVEKGTQISVVESVKTTQDVYAPISGEIVEVNTGLVIDPAKVNTAPYQSGWIFKMRLSSPKQVHDLMDAGSYAAMIS